MQAIFHESAIDTDAGVIWASGARGGFNGPAGGVYTNLSQEFSTAGIRSLRINYRDPGEFNESVYDLRCGLEYLKGRGCTKVILVGHSFGGAVVIFTAIDNDQVSGVVSLSPQTAGAQGAPAVSPRPLLVVHGLEDTRLTPDCARNIYHWAKEPKELVLFPGAEHGLRECADELHDLLRRWIPEQLIPSTQQPT